MLKRYIFGLCVAIIAAPFMSAAASATPLFQGRHGSSQGGWGSGTQFFMDGFRLDHDDDDRWFDDHGGGGNSVQYGRSHENDDDDDDDHDGKHGKKHDDDDDDDHDGKHGKKHDDDDDDDDEHDGKHGKKHDDDDENWWEDGGFDGHPDWGWDPSKHQIGCLYDHDKKDDCRTNTKCVPVPGAALLGSLGLMLAGAVRRRQA